MQKLGWHSLGTSFDCPCGIRHELPIETCHVGETAALELAKFARERCGNAVLAVSDENTFRAGGEPVVKALRDAGKRIIEQRYPGAPFEATGERAEETAAAGKDADFYVAIGSGTVSDLAKYAGSVQKKPVLLFPTAASMNGYTSGITALKIRGLKRTQPCRPVTGIFANPEVIATAPQRMLAAGVADFLSKCSSAADWRASHLLRGDYYCHRPREFNEGIQERLFEAAPAVGRAEPEAVRLVMEALLLSGFGMVIAGSSAPASGGEHLISHYLDMKHALYNTANDLHGTQVGVGTVHALGLWEKVLALDPKDVDVNALADAHPSPEQIREHVLADWGTQVGEEVWAQWTQKAPSTEKLREELERFKRMLPELREALGEDIQPAAVVARCIETSGGPIGPEDLYAPVEEYQKALKAARYLRNRFTILDLAAELGIP
ncbi:MAG TPA: iron-containing alcohol dehydrogenase [Candidatus Hydrogenedentes bacterium]|nr:iron-containing alcohol dehydrogenase [Candidatus Hydrogenedentota bacterium]